MCPSDEEDLTLDDFPEDDAKKVKPEEEEEKKEDFESDDILNELETLEKDLAKLAQSSEFLERAIPDPFEEPDTHEKITVDTVKELEEKESIEQPPMDISQKEGDGALLKLFVGYEKETRNKFYLPFPTDGSLLHSGVFAKAGWGKTGLLQVLMEECALNGIPIFYFSEKDDMKRMINFAEREDISPDLLPYYEEIKKKIDVCVFTNPPNTEGIPLSLNPFKNILTNEELAELVQESPHKENLMIEQRNQTISDIVRTILKKCRFTQNTINKYLPYLVRFINICIDKNIEIPDIQTLISLIANPPLDALLSLGDVYNIKGREKRSLLTRLETLTIPPLKYIFSGSGYVFDVDKLIAPRDGKTPINIFVFPKLDSNQKKDFVASALQNIVHWSKRKGEAQDQVRMIVIVDEAHVFAPSGAAQPPTKQPILHIAQVLRSAGIVLLVASQRLNTVDRNIRANLNFQFFGMLNDIDDRKTLLRYLTNFTRDGDLSEIERTYNDLKEREFLVVSSAPKIQPTPVYIRDVMTSTDTVDENELLEHVEQHKQFFPFEVQKSRKPIIVQETYTVTAQEETKDLTKYYIQDIGKENLHLNELIEKLIQGNKNFSIQNIEVIKFFVPFKYFTKKITLTTDVEFALGSQSVEATLDTTFPVTFFLELSDRMDLSLLTQGQETIQVAFDPSKLFNVEKLDLMQLMTKLDSAPASQIVLPIRKSDQSKKDLPIFSYEKSAHERLRAEIEKQWHVILNHPKEYGISDDNNILLIKEQLKKEKERLIKVTKDAQAFKPSFEKFKKAYTKAQEQLKQVKKEYQEMKRGRLTASVQQYYQNKIAALKKRVEKSQEGIALYKEIQQEFLEQKKIVDELTTKIKELEKVRIEGYESLTPEILSTIFHMATKTERDSDAGIVYLPAAIVRLHIRTADGKNSTKYMLVNYYDGQEIVGMCDQCHENILKRHRAEDNIFYSALYICGVCGNLLCKNHTKEYNESYYCLDHFSICKICGEEKLLKELATCEICDSTVCNEHVRRCEICGKSVCSACGRMMEKKMVFGKKEMYVCNRCYNNEKHR